MAGADGIVGLHTYDSDLQHSGLLVRFVPESLKNERKRIGFLAAIAPVEFSTNEGEWEGSLQSRLQEMAQTALEEKGYYTRMFSGHRVGQSIDSLLENRANDNDTLLSALTEYVLDMSFEDQSSDDPPLVVVVIRAQLFSMTRNEVVWESSTASSSEPRTLYIQTLYTIQPITVGGVGKDGYLLAIEKAASNLFASLPSPRDLSSTEEEK
jgi:hypothetical protein